MTNIKSLLCVSGSLEERTSLGRAQTRGIWTHFGINSLLKFKLRLHEVSLFIYRTKGELGVSKNEGGKWFRNLNFGAKREHAQSVTYHLRKHIFMLLCV